jgi:adenosylhomocysteine nucleosidase
MPVVTAISGFGKVSAAATVTGIIDGFSPSHVIFGGVAGGIGDVVDIGDVVVADRLVQHDFDASPVFDRFVIPSLGIAEIPTDPDLTARLFAAAARYVAGPFQNETTAGDRSLFDASRTKIHQGLVASGDRFVAHVAEAQTLLRDLPEVLAVEMEGAAVAQVCTERDVPFAVFRSISDRADHHADVDFLAFLASFAAPMTAGVIGELLSELS